MSTTQELLDLFPDMLVRHVHNLKLRGEKANGLCPFHPEKTPSFTAHLGKGVYFCFGCGAKGGVIAFAKATGTRLPGWSRPAETPLRNQRQRLAREIEAEYRAWKEKRYLDAVFQVITIEANLHSLNACFRFRLDNVSLESLHQLIDSEQAELFDAIACLDVYSPNPLVDDTEAQREWRGTPAIASPSREC